ncbi:MAG: DUF3048 domain-containing protein [Eubacterium sp.]|nr:DUF3048 domain-containing protein [Eubacterium sp.]
MKKVLSVILCAIIIAALFGCAKKEEPATTTQTTTQTTQTTTAAPVYTNPLTGKEGYNKSAVGVRPVAIVVENLRPARPQWGIGSSDIIVEGEVEGGISRMLWIYADMTSVPKKIGPIRSARPSYVKFSEFFDSIYIHWGGSHSKGGYTGGYGVIKKDKVDHIDGMNGGKLFSRDTTRRVSSEHRGILNGKKIPEVIKDKKFRTALDENKFSNLEFNESKVAAGSEKAEKISARFSKRTDTRKFTYKDGKYHCSDWETDVKFQNVIILSDETKYITTPYKGSSTTYVNYLYKGHDGYYASKGTQTKIKWEVKDNKLYLKDLNGNPLKINQGKSYIGLASSNNGGKITFTNTEG